MFVSNYDFLMSAGDLHEDRRACHPAGLQSGGRLSGEGLAKEIVSLFIFQRRDKAPQVFIASALVFKVSRCRS